MNFEYYFERVLNYYNVSTIKDLSKEIKTEASTISNWKQRNSVTALKKRCRELGIYNEIFGDNHNDKLKNIKIEENIIINSVLLEQAKNEASKFGLNINSYLEHLIIQDLKK